MATSPSQEAYLREQLGGAEILSKRMFGEYGFYFQGKFFAVACDDSLYFKPTKAGRAMLEKAERLVEAPAYEGAGLYFLIEDVDDAAFLRELRDVSWEELPLPKPRKPKAGKAL